MGWTFVVRVVDTRERDAAADDLVAGFGAGFLVVERAAPDELFERVVVLVFRAGEVVRDAMVATLTDNEPFADDGGPPAARLGTLGTWTGT